MPRPDFVLRQGDHGQLIAATLRDQDDEPQNISGADIRLKMAPIEGGLAVLDVEASNDQVDPATTGQVSYEWQASDTVTPGHYLAEWEVTFVDDSVVTFPNAGYVHILITPQLVAAP